ncbi:MAG: acylphosphatase [Candidatus Cloacimonetes bacterium]|jgi:acylphosphatase|nr:acylphosphatase [Candidatus Cloacimonadota bacterium]
MEARTRVVITGRVQGVGFRAWAVQQARTLGLRGWIRNRADGAVEAEMAGDPDAVARMRDLLAQGPPLARVERLVDEQPGVESLPDTFQTVW